MSTSGKFKHSPQYERIEESIKQESEASTFNDQTIIKISVFKPIKYNSIHNDMRV